MKVELIDHMGSDLSVVNAARASFGKESKEFSEKDAKLIRFLAREKHLLPFRHPQITLRMKVPIFVARQLGKSQVGMSWSEESRRYIDSDPEFFYPDKWRQRAESVKQGSSDEEFPSSFYDGYGIVDTKQTIEDHYTYSLNLYKEVLRSGMAPEQARMLLPQAMYTTVVWTGSLLSFVHLIHERTTVGTQKETRDVALQIKEILTPLYPISMEALIGE